MGDLIRVSAPGKAFLFGEYAVLFGGEAVVMAVDRYAVASVGQGEKTSPLVLAARDGARWLVEAAGERWIEEAVSVNSGSLRNESGRKLGLGSSAAALVAAIGAHAAACSCDIEAPRFRESLLHTAIAAHDDFQGAQGSGGDIAAAVNGGLIRFHRSDAGEIDMSRMELPDGLAVRFVDVGRAARTGPMVRRVRDGYQEDRPEVRSAVEELIGLASDFVANGVADLDKCVSAVGGYRKALMRLGRAAGISIVTPPHRRVAEVAETFGGAAKPSGAGGGDLAVCFLPSDIDGEHFARTVEDAGFVVLDLARDLHGLRLGSGERGEVG